MFLRSAFFLRVSFACLALAAVTACSSSQNSNGGDSAWSDAEPSGGLLSAPDDSWGDEEDSSKRRVFGGEDDSWEDEPSVSNKRILTTGKDSWDEDDAW